MFKLAVGFAISSALLCTACGDDYAWADPLYTGTAIFDLPSSDGFSLAAEIDLSAQDAAAAVSQVTVTEADSSVQVELLPGSYSAAIGSFTLFRDGEPMAAAEVTFVGFEPDPIVITAFAVTRVALTFREVESGTDIESGDGAPRLVVNRECGTGCTAAQICANVNGAGAACYTTCDADTPCTAADTRCVIPAGDDSGICI